MEHALSLARLQDGRVGLPAGAVKKSVLESTKGLDTDTRNRVMSCFHVLGEQERNFVPLTGEPKEADFDFEFKKPKRTLTMTLPQFDEWSCTFDVQLASGSLSQKDLKKFLNKAGAEIGIGHRRPEMGMFEVVKMVSK